MDITKREPETAMRDQKTNSSKQIRKYILTCMILVPLVPMVVILAIGYFYFTSALTSTSTATMRRIAEDHRQMIEAFLMERKTDLEFVLYTHSFDDLRRQERLGAVFENLLRKSNAFADLGLFDENGLHVAYRGPYHLAGKVYKEAVWFREALEKGHYISDVFLGYRNIPHFIVAVSREVDGRKMVIRATIDTVMFNDLVKNVRIGKTGEAYLLNREGILQTERRSGGSLMEKDPEIDTPLVPHPGIQTLVKTGLTGQDYLYATIWMNDQKWELVVRQDKAEVFKALQTTVYLVVLAVVLGGGVIVATAVYLAERIVVRIQKADMDKGHLQNQLVRAGRLAELGEMAAGFAHEINNPLQIIKSEHALIETILEDLKQKQVLTESEDMADLEDSIKQIVLQVNRCAEITHSILKFGRKNKAEIQKVALDQFIPEITKMVQKKAQVQGITVQQHIADDTPQVYGDPAQLQQVLLNLCNNAIDAIYARHGSSGGYLHVEAGPDPDNMIWIKVADNGCGIDEENLQKVFSPFFTTKPVGEGTGLGLSICYGIIAGMGGKMEVSSKSGEGTTFYVRLPTTG